MNNPFNIPDEIFDAMIASAITRSINQSMAGGTNNDRKKVSPKRGTTVEDGAIAAKKVYDAYVKAGFNEVQAFELLKLILSK